MRAYRLLLRGKIGLPDFAEKLEGRAYDECAKDLRAMSPNLIQEDPQTVVVAVCTLQDAHQTLIEECCQADASFLAAVEKVLAPNSQLRSTRPCEEQ